MNQRDEDRWASMKLYGAGEQAWERMDAFADGAAHGRRDAAQRARMLVQQYDDAPAWLGEFLTTLERDGEAS